jgi:hypothetical protein
MLLIESPGRTALMAELIALRQAGGSAATQRNPSTLFSPSRSIVLGPVVTLVVRLARELIVVQPET